MKGTSGSRSLGVPRGSLISEDRAGGRVAFLFFGNDRGGGSDRDGGWWAGDGC